MAKEVTVLALEGDVLRALRLVEDGSDWSRADARSWSLAAAEPSGEAGEEAAEGAEEPSGEEPAEPAASDALTEAFAGAVDHFKTHHFVMALPLSAMLTRTVAVEADLREDMPDSAAAALASVSPFPDEALVCGVETVAESDACVTALAAALPAASVEAVGEAMLAAKAYAVKTDAALMGWLRVLWPRIVETSCARRLVLADFGSGWEAALVVNGAILALRALAGAAPEELVREVTLTLMSSEAGADGVDEIVICSLADGRPAPDLLQRLAVFGAVREVAAEDEYSGAEGVALRYAEGGGFDVTPASWSDARREAIFRRKLTTFLAAAFGLWALALGVLVGTPFVYGYLTQREQDICKAHRRAYGEVKDMKDRVNLVKRYSDHARGALEMLRAVSEKLPEGVTLSSFSYDRDSGVTVQGEADQPTLVYELKNNLQELPAGEEDAETLVFPSVKLTGPSQTRGGRHKFSIDASFVEEEEKK